MHECKQTFKIKMFSLFYAYVLSYNFLRIQMRDSLNINNENEKIDILKNKYLISDK